MFYKEKLSLCIFFPNNLNKSHDHQIGYVIDRTCGCSFELLHNGLDEFSFKPIRKKFILKRKEKESI